MSTLATTNPTSIERWDNSNCSFRIWLSSCKTKLSLFSGLRKSSTRSAFSKAISHTDNLLIRKAKRDLSRAIHSKNWHCMTPTGPYKMTAMTTSVLQIWALALYWEISTNHVLALWASMIPAVIVTADSKLNTLSTKIWMNHSKTSFRLWSNSFR